jgi:hypothetical protein
MDGTSSGSCPITGFSKHLSGFEVSGPATGELDTIYRNRTYCVLCEQLLHEYGICYRRG